VPDASGLPSPTRRIVAVIASLLIVGLIAAYVVFHLSRRPKQLENGEWRVIDHADGPLRNVLALIALLLGTQYALGFGMAMLEGIRKKPDAALLGLLLVVALYGWLLWTQGRKVYEALHAAPGELRVDHWPLAAGEHIALTYRRKLHRGLPAGDVQATLVHYEVTRGYTNSRNSQKRTTKLAQVRLEDGEASFSDNELVATWRFQVPNAMGNPIESLKRSFFDLMSNRHTEDEWWALEVEMPLQGGAKLDSSFRLDIRYIEGRTQFHLGA
jgi:hypothetical protein